MASYIFYFHTPLWYGSRYHSYMARYNIFLTDSDIYYLEEQEVKTNEVALPVSWARGSEMQTVPSIPTVSYFLHTLL